MFCDTKGVNDTFENKVNSFLTGNKLLNITY